MSSSPAAPANTTVTIYPERNFVLTWIYSLLLGSFGFDRFYLGKVATGILKLFTLGGLGLWTFIDLIIVLAGAARDRYGRALAGYEKYKTFAWIVSVALMVGVCALGYWQSQR